MRALGDRLDVHDHIYRVRRRMLEVIPLWYAYEWRDLSRHLAWSFQATIPVLDRASQGYP